MRRKVVEFDESESRCWRTMRALCHSLPPLDVSPPMICSEAELRSRDSCELREPIKRNFGESELMRYIGVKNLRG